VKKVMIFIYVIAVLLVFIGASPWEGAATVASDGELPATGRFVATNSFPVNTIVDITNIENNRSMRVIVANKLNSPGLLAVVSAEVAELIGMRVGSVARIRMVQPSDPIAYLRFTEGLDANIPEYYSGGTSSEEYLLNEVYGTETYRASDESSVAANEDGLRGPSYTLEPEWSGRRIIDLPGYVEYSPFETQTETVQAPVETQAEQPPIDETPQYIVQAPIQTVTVNPTEQELDEIIKDIDEKIDERPNEEVIKDLPEYMAESLREEIEKDVSEYMAEVLREEAEKDISDYLAEVPSNEAEKEVEEKIDEELREEVAKDIPERTEVEQVTQAPPSEQPEFVLIPTDERPPENTIYGIDPADIIPGLATAPPVQETIITPPAPPPAVPAVTDSAFSIPTIYSLDYGKYYVQVAALDTHEQVEAVICRIDPRYDPKVFRDRDNKYRIVLGPLLNTGESAAVLQRFKSIGFSDAFVRRH